MATNNVDAGLLTGYPNIMATHNSGFYMFKICSRCKLEKKITNFKVDKRQLDGRTITCRHCYTYNKLDKWVPTPEQIEKRRQKMIGRKHSIETRLAMSEGQKRAIAEGRRQGKILEVPDKELERSSLKYQLWRNKVMELNGNYCETCKSDKRIHVHHIKSYYDFPELRTDTNNGQILCLSCHMKYHNTKENRRDK